MARTDLLTAGPASPASAQIDCPLCGHRFPAEVATCHDGCPLSRHCRTICCPRCGYEVVDTARLRARLQRWSARARRFFGRSA